MPFRKQWGFIGLCPFRFGALRIIDVAPSNFTARSQSVGA
jgi:hypothetical protein